MNIGLIFMLVSIILSIAKANMWFYVPFFCLSFCWIVGIYYVFIYSFSKTMARIIINDLEKKVNADKNSEKEDKLNKIKKYLMNSL